MPLQLEALQVDAFNLTKAFQPRSYCNIALLYCDLSFESIFWYLGGLIPFSYVLSVLGYMHHSTLVCDNNLCFLTQSLASLQYP